MDSMAFLLPVVLVIGLFLLGRSLVLWYWKVDRVVDLLEKQNQLLEGQKDLLIKLLATQKVALHERTSSTGTST